MKLNANLKLDPTTIASFVGGAVVGTLVNGYLTPLTQDSKGQPLPSDKLKRNGMIVAGSKIALGGYAAFKVKSPIVKAMGVGVLVVGGLELINSLLPDNMDSPFVGNASYDYEEMTQGVYGTRGGLSYGAVGRSYESVGGGL